MLMNALKFFLVIMLSSHTFASHSLLDQANMALEKGDYVEALMLFKESAELGSDQAMFQIGLMYESGRVSRKMIKKQYPGIENLRKKETLRRSQYWVLSIEMDSMSQEILIGHFTGSKKHQIKAMKLECML